MTYRKLIIFFISLIIVLTGCKMKTDSVFKQNELNVVFGVSTTDCINCRAVIMQLLKKVGSIEHVNIVILFNVPKMNKSQTTDILNLGNEFSRKINFLSSRIKHGELKDQYQIEGNTFVIIKSAENEVIYKAGYKEISIIDIDKVLFSN